ncbi:hypothetical protein LY76DRAFT_153630 [Colletotrichum caudatum]|nr:hypothetical protein LY76DRAFT_153630 [Colletotrichum caudatum]
MTKKYREDEEKDADGRAGVSDGLSCAAREKSTPRDRYLGRMAVDQDAGCMRLDKTTGHDAGLPIHPCSLPVRTFLPEMNKLVGRGMGLFKNKDPMTASCLPQPPLPSSALDFITTSSTWLSGPLFSLPSFASRIFPSLFTAHSSMTLRHTRS